jgi:hypothetical protein
VWAVHYRASTGPKNARQVRPAEPIDNSTLVGAAWAYLFLVEQCVDLFAAGRKPEVAALAEEYGRLFGDNPVEDPNRPV